MDINGLFFLFVLFSVSQYKNNNRSCTIKVNHFKHLQQMGEGIDKEKP